MTRIIPTTVERPWGKYIEFTRNTSSTVKILEVKKGESLSKQLHHLREEYWYVLSGTGTAFIGDTPYPLSPGVDYFISKEQIHRIEATTEDITILEIALGDAEEDDIVRIEDKYGRTH